MATKICRRCGKQKDLSEFYAHPYMADGYLNICKICKCAYQRKYSKTKVGRIVEKRRNKKPERKAKLKARVNAWEKKNRHKRNASQQARRAVKAGKLTKPAACEDCGVFTDKLHGHHEDYSKPLEVTWLCVPCHGKRNPNYVED